MLFFLLGGMSSPFEPPESAALEINQIHKILHFRNFLITINVVLSDEIYFLVRIWTKDGKDFFREIRIDSQSTPAVTWSRRFLIICAESDVLFYDLKLLDDIKWRTEGKFWKCSRMRNLKKNHNFRIWKIAYCDPLIFDPIVLFRIGSMIYFSTKN